MINLTKTEKQLQDEMLGKVNLSKDKEILGNHIVNLSKSIVNLSKKHEIDLGSSIARVVVALDYSGSMSNLYSNGTVQRTLNKLVPMGLKFDDNGELEVYIFSNDYKYITTMTIDNYEDYVKKHIQRSGMRMGGTSYEPVLSAIVNEMCLTSKKKGLLSSIFGKKEKQTQNGSDDSNVPVFIIFITDGENSDKHETDKIIRESANHNVFIQFVGIGDERFDYLRKLDDLDGRKCDNTGFIQLNSLENIDDIDLYNSLIEQYADWLKVK